MYECRDKDGEGGMKKARDYNWTECGGRKKGEKEGRKWRDRKGGEGVDRYTQGEDVIQC